MDPETGKLSQAAHMQRLADSMKSPLPVGALPVARVFGQIVGRCESAFEKYQAENGGGHNISIHKDKT